MKTNPSRLSLVFALIVSVLIFAVSIIIHYLLYDDAGILFSLIFALVFFPITYFVFRSTLEKFIHEKIKIIYKTILKSRNDSSVKRNGQHRSDILEAVNLEVEQWAESREKEIADLKKLEKYRREFLGNVSHELKTPITTIQGYVLTLLDGGMDDPRVNKKYLLRTAKSIKRMIAIVNDLESISRFEAGVIQLQQGKFNLISALLEVFDFMEMKAQKRNVRLVYSGSPETPCYVHADREKIRQVLVNLVDNSLKYGKESGTTTASVYDMDDHVLVEIADDGIGIEETDLPRIFERFYRTEKSRARAQGGSGLGLAIVKHIIEAHDQSIHVQSKVGTGSTFSFTLKKA